MVSTQVLAVAAHEILTGPLEKDGTSREHTALQPCHTVAEIVQLDLSRSSRLAHPRDSDILLAIVAHRDLDHPRTAASLSALCLLDAIVLDVVGEEVRASGTGRRALHLSREVAARIDTGALAEAVWDFVGVHPLQSDAHPKAGSSHIVLDEDELALLGLGNVGEEIIVLVGTGSLMAATRHSTARMGSHMRHRASGRAGRIALVGVAGEDLCLPDIPVATWGTM